MKYVGPAIVTPLEAKHNKDFNALVELRKSQSLHATKKHIVDNCNGSADDIYYTLVEKDLDEQILGRTRYGKRVDGPRMMTRREFAAYWGEWHYDGPGEES